MLKARQAEKCICHCCYKVFETAQCALTCLFIVFIHVIYCLSTWTDSAAAALLPRSHAVANGDRPTTIAGEKQRTAANQG